VNLLTPRGVELLQDVLVLINACHTRWGFGRGQFMVPCTDPSHGHREQGDTAFTTAIALGTAALTLLEEARGQLIAEGMEPSVHAANLETVVTHLDALHQEYARLDSGRGGYAALPVYGGALKRLEAATSVAAEEAADRRVSAERVAARGGDLKDDYWTAVVLLGAATSLYRATGTLLAAWMSACSQADAATLERLELRRASLRAASAACAEEFTIREAAWQRLSATTH